jgi:hypothetical protein
MQAADPARHMPQTDSWLPDPVEATMRTSTEVPLSNRRWVPALAGAAAIAVIGVGTYAVLGQDDVAPRTEPTTMVLSMPDTGTSMPSCIPFTVDVLRDMPVAFSGTATDVAEDTVTLDVDHWYRGGEADAVVLERYDTRTASIEGLDISEGDRYLITATGGTVNLCGYSVPWSSEMATAFDEAFGF